LKIIFYEEDEMEEQFSTLVNLLWEECIRSLNSILSEEEVNKFSNNDYYYLLVIHSLQKPNFSQIADKLSFTKPAVSAMIKKLMNMKLVEKVQSTEDKRMYYVELTAKGRSILQGDRAVYQWVTDTVTEIAGDEKELILIQHIISELVDRLEKRKK
jgi:DNA-binding MarR family transcriptional regulator